MTKLDRELTARSKARKDLGEEWSDDAKAGYMTDLADVKKKTPPIPYEQQYPVEALEHAHVRMIIGYNSKTGELAFSDSWGEKYAERWMTFEEAQYQTQSGDGALLVVKW